jgi:hypothetical protein
MTWLAMATRWIEQCAAEENRSPSAVRANRADAASHRRLSQKNPQVAQRLSCLPVAVTVVASRHVNMPVSSISGSPASASTHSSSAHSLRRTKATLIYRRNGNPRAVYEDRKHRSLSRHRD